MPEELFPIDEVARAFAIRTSALRYYEEIGLVAPSGRKGRVRHYDMDALRRLALALLWHDDGGAPLDDTRKLLDSGGRAVRWALIEENIGRIDKKAAELERARAVLAHMLECPEEVIRNVSHSDKIVRRSLTCGLPSKPKMLRLTR